MLADGEPGPAPGVGRSRTPHEMLESEALDLHVLGAENVVAF
jgi:hypothetical protein